MIQSQTVSQRSVEVIRFTCNLHLFVGTHTVECTHIVQTVSQLDKNSTHIVLHRCENLTEIIHLLRLLVFILLLLGNDTYKECHIIAETLTNILDGVIRILDNIVQESGNNGVCTQFQLFGYDTGNCNRMDNIWFTRFATLIFVGFRSQSISITHTLHILSRDTLLHISKQRFYTLTDLGCVDVVHNGFFFKLVTHFHSCCITLSVVSQRSSL